MVSGQWSVLLTDHYPLTINAGWQGITHVINVDKENPKPIDIGRLIAAIYETPDAVIIGKRLFPAFGTQRRAILSAFWFRLQTGQILKDASSFYRVYPITIFKNLKFYHTGFLFHTEILVKAAWAGVKIREIPITAPYKPPAWKKESILRAIWISLQLFILNFMLAMRSVAPVPHRKIVENTEGEKISVLRPLKSIKSLLAEHTTPIQLAGAGALGVFIGTLPLIACHTLVILFAAGFFRLNRIAAVAASQLCMPPFIPALCIEAGYFMRYGEFLTTFSLETLGYQAHQRLFEWMIGSLVIAPIAALLVAGIIFIMAWGIRNK